MKTFRKFKRQNRNWAMFCKLIVLNDCDRKYICWAD